MKIIVDTQELKDQLIAESKYVHDYVYVNRSRKNGKTKWIGLDSDKAGILMHIYVCPEIIIVEEPKNDTIHNK